MTGTIRTLFSAPLVLVLALAACKTVFSGRIQISSHDSNKQRAEESHPGIPGLYVHIAIAQWEAKKLASITAPGKLSYIRLPKAEHCMADPTSNVTFFSVATNRSSDPRKCSMCRSIVASLSEVEVSWNWFGWFGHNDTGMSILACSNMSKAVPGLQLACQKLARWLFYEVGDFHQKVRELATATDLGARFAAHASCEDLQCCPQDPFVAEVVAGVASEGLKRPEDVNNAERLGVVGAMLGSPGVRSNLEEHLAYLSIQKSTVDDESFVAPQLILDDKQCTWDYSEAKCKHPDVCQFEFQTGDLLLDDSCRLKPSATAPPQSDSDCKWDYSVSQCHKPEYCSRQCKAADTSLSDCCRLRVHVSEAAEDGSKSEEGNCAGQEDRAVMSAPGKHAEFEKIQNDTFSIWKMQIDAEKSFDEHVALGLSQKCASCFVDFSKCSVSNCFTQLDEDIDSREAMACLAAHCTPDLVSCAGVDALELPQRA